MVNRHEAPTLSALDLHGKQAPWRSPLGRRGLSSDDYSLSSNAFN